MEGATKHLPEATGVHSVATSVVYRLEMVRLNGKSRVNRGGRKKFKAHMAEASFWVRHWLQ